MTKYFVERYKGLGRSNPEVSLSALAVAISAQHEAHRRMWRCGCLTALIQKTWMSRMMRSAGLSMQIGYVDAVLSGHLPKLILVLLQSQDVIAVSVLLPEHRTDSSWSVEITAGEGDQYERKVVLDRTSDLQTFIVPFSPGQVSFQVKEGAETVLEGTGESITDIGTERYNFNAWTGHWSRKVS